MFRRRSAGQSLVEFSLVVPVLLLFILGIVDGGRAIFAFNQMSQISRDVARVASVTCFQTDPRCDSTTPNAPVTKAIARSSAGLQGPLTVLIECVAASSLDSSNPTKQGTYTTHSLDSTQSNACAVGDIVRVHTTLTFNLLYGPLAGDFGVVHVGSTSDQQILQ
jgi:Flp pilus assembly protein TadG